MPSVQTMIDNVKIRRKLWQDIMLAVGRYLEHCQNIGDDVQLHIVEKSRDSDNDEASTDA